MPFDGQVAKYEVVTQPRRVTKLELLELVQGKIDSPDKWTKGSYHTRVNGQDRYCLMGALGAVAQDLGWTKKVELDVLLQDAETNFAKNVLALPKRYEGGVTVFNDRSNFQQVQKMLKRSIKRAKRQEFVRWLKRQGPVTYGV